MFVVEKLSTFMIIFSHEMMIRIKLEIIEMIITGIVPMDRGSDRGSDILMI